MDAVTVQNRGGGANNGSYGLPHCASRLSLFAAFAFASLVAGAAWFDSPEVKATVATGSYGIDPHYINLSEDGAWLLVDTHSSKEAYPVQLYSVAELKAASGSVKRLAAAFALAEDFYGTGTGDGGWKGGAVSSALGLAIPGSGKENGAAYTAFSVPAFGWKAGDTAFEVEGVGDAGFDGLDFNPAGTVLYANQYAKGSRNKILAYDTSALKTEHTLSLLSTKTVDGVSRIRNLSCYNVAGRDLVYFGEGAVSGSNNTVYVYDPAEDTVTALVTDASLFDKDIMNVKLSNVASGCPTLYVQTDNCRLHVFLLAPDGKSVTSKTPVRSFTAAECTALCGLASKPSKFRNFEVTDDGETAFFIANGDAPLAVVASGYTGDAYIETAPQYTADKTGNAVFTDYFFNANSRIEVDFEFRDNSNGFIFSPWEQSGNYSGLWRDDGVYKLFAGDKWFLPGPEKKSADANVRHFVVLDAKNMEAYLETDGVKEEFDISGCKFSQANWPMMFLGAATTYDGVRSVNTTHYARARIYRATIQENGTTVRDYVPAIVNGVPCLYDTVNGSVAADTRDGVAPPNVVGDVLRVAGETYVQLTSATDDLTNKGVNTGYKMKGTSRVELDCHVAANTPGDSRPMGAWNKEATFKNLVYVNQKMYKAFLNAAYDGRVETGAYVNGKRQTFVFDAPNAKSQMIRDGVVLVSAAAATAPAADIVADTPLAVFADCNNADGTAFISPALGMKAYSLAIKENGATVTNFVPCLGIEGVSFKDEITGETLAPKILRYFSYGVDAADSSSQEGFLVKTTDTATTGILTSWRLDAQARLECDFALGVKDNAQRIVGCWNNSADKLRSLVWTASGKFEFFVNGGGSTFKSTAAADAERHVHFFDLTTEGAPTTGYYTDGELVQRESSATFALANATDRSHPVSVFADNNGSGAFAQGVKTGGRFYGMKAFQCGGVVHKWLPATKDGAVGIADRLTAAFIAAPADHFAAVGDVWEAASDAYIQTSGGVVLDTGYKPKKTSRVEVDMMPLSASGCYFGNYGGSNSDAYTLWCQDSHVEAMMLNGNNNSSKFFYPRNDTRFTGVLDFMSQKGYVVLDGIVPDEYVSDQSYKTFPDGWESRNNLGVCGSIQTDTAICAGPAPASMRCYAVRIYENDELVRLFLPYSGDDGVGLKCALTGAKALRHAASTGADPVYVAGPLAVTADEVAQIATDGPSDFRLTSKTVKTISASAPGASFYRWTRNGIVVGETDGSLGIGWRKTDDVDEFSVTPVYVTSSGEVEGRSVDFTVSHTPSSFLLILR